MHPITARHLRDRKGLSRAGGDGSITVGKRNFFRIVLPSNSSTCAHSNSFRISRGKRLIATNNFRIRPTVAVPTGTLDVAVNHSNIIDMARRNRTTPIRIKRLGLAAFVGSAKLRDVNRGLCARARSSNTPGRDAPNLGNTKLLCRKCIRASGIGITRRLIGVVRIRHTCRVGDGTISAASRVLRGLARLWNLANNEFANLLVFRSSDRTGGHYTCLYRFRLINTFAGQLHLSALRTTNTKNSRYAANSQSSTHHRQFCFPIYSTSWL